MDELQKTAVDCNRGLYIHNEYNWARDEILRNIGKYTKRAELFAASRKSLIKLFISLIFKFFFKQKHKLCYSKNLVYYWATLQ